MENNNNKDNLILTGTLLSQTNILEFLKQPAQLKSDRLPKEIHEFMNR